MLEGDRRRGDGPQADLREGHGPTLAAGIVFGAALSVAPWLRLFGGTAAIAGPTVCALSALTGWALARGLAPRWAMAAPASAAVLGFASATLDYPTPSAAWGLATAATLAAASLGATVIRRGATTAGSGALGAAALVALARLDLPPSQAAAGWIVLAGGSAALLGGAAILAWTARAAAADLPTGLWIGASAALALYAIEARVPGPWASPAYAVAALAYAAAAVRPGWSGLREVTGAAALAALVALFGPATAEAALTGRLSLGLLAAVSGASAGLLWSASWALWRRETARTAADGLATTALLVALTGAFLGLRVLASSHGAVPARLDPFSEAGLRTALLLAAGVASRPSAVERWTVRWRRRALLGAGAAHGLLMQGVWLNPWWGEGGTVSGPPLIDALALGLLVPAGLLAAAAVRRARATAASRSVAEEAVTLGLAGLAFGLLWLPLELRRVFHGPMLPGPFAPTECAAYGVAALGVAALLQAGAVRLGGAVAKTTAEISGWIAPASAIVLFGDVASPWWGPLDASLQTVKDAALWLALYAAGIALAGRLGVRWRDLGRGALAQASAASAVAQGFVLLTLSIRLAYRGLDLRPALHDAGAETWTYSVAWTVYGIIVLGLGVGRGSIGLRWMGLAVLLGAVAKVFLFDMARLDGVVRAGSFLALGGLLLAAALAARRLGGGGTPER